MLYLNSVLTSAGAVYASRQLDSKVHKNESNNEKNKNINKIYQNAVAVDMCWYLPSTCSTGFPETANATDNNKRS